MWKTTSLLILSLTVSSIPFNAVYANKSSKPATQVGIASYYGHRFHGRMTANGERFNKEELSAAHRSYPFGTLLRVTNLDNQKSTLVRINDRGPYIKGRIIDLSHRAARELSFVDEGITRVKLEVIELGSDDT
ncbi:MAG: hypothetical protein BWK79_01260 [Beggiatoa sp. IS2]|nr:MAG: hypothetical protein BWK79_01260 [Beggiatoa sp. IS2]